MSLRPVNYETAKAAYKPMRRSALRPRTSLKRGTKQLKRSRMKPHRQSPEENQWREEVLKRDGYQCRWIHSETKRRCRRRGEQLHAHHILERSQRPDLVLVVENGAALCSEHHDRLHHTVAGRLWGRMAGLLGGETYEKARKKLTA